MNIDMDTLMGVTEVKHPQNGGTLLSRATPSGWRKATIGLATADRLSQIGRYAEISKSRAFVAVKRVAPQVGLKAGPILLLDTLGAFTQAQDWETGQRPIVWPSNECLMEKTGFSLSTLKRHTRRLAEAGMISFQDSPNGKRWGRRDTDGRIIEAYGFDLSPLAARAEEFEQLHAELQAEREFCQRLKRQITVARRTIRAHLEDAIQNALIGPWNALMALFEKLLAKLTRRQQTSGQLSELLNQLVDLRNRVVAEYQSSTEADHAVENASNITQEVGLNTKALTPKGSKNEPHIQTTKQHLNVTCTREGNAETSQQDVAVQGNEKINNLEQNSQAAPGTTPRRLELRLILNSCTEFATWTKAVGAALMEWSNIHKATAKLAPMIGVTDRVWKAAQSAMGIETAVAAFALLFEKANLGEVASPNGYMRGMIRKFGEGQLNLDRSFYGRLNAQAA